MAPTSTDRVALLMSTSVSPPGQGQHGIGEAHERAHDLGQRRHDHGTGHQQTADHRPDNQIAAKDGLGFRLDLCRSCYRRDIVTGRFHAGFQVGEVGHEGREFCPGKISIARGQGDDPLGRHDIGVQRWLYLGQGLTGCRILGQGLVGRQTLAKDSTVFGEFSLHVCQGDSALGIDGQQCGEGIGAQGIVHHVGAHVIAQHLAGTLR